MVFMERTVHVLTPCRWVRTFRLNKVSVVRVEELDSTVWCPRTKWSLGRQRNVQLGCLRGGKCESRVSSSGVGHGEAKWTGG